MPNQRDIIREIRALLDELEDEAPRTPLSGPFLGRLMQSRYSGRCVICGKPYSAGTSIIYNGDLRKASHAECGQQDRKRQQ